jgi:hypothetical protein
MNTKLHAVTDANGRPPSFFMTVGQVNDYTGATALLDDLPKALWLLGDRGYDADCSGMPYRPRAFIRAYQVRGPGLSPSNTTRAATGAVAASRSCSDG